MKRLLLPLLAAIALPTAVNAETVWLILRYGSVNAGMPRMAAAASLEKIEMKDLNHCKSEGDKWAQSILPKGEKKSLLTYHCIVGK